MVKRIGLLALGLAMIAPTPGHACNEVISWYADLKGSAETPAVETSATGKATIVFDFDNPKATMTIDNTGLADVTKIELHACLTYNDMTGPAIATLYVAKDGPLTASYQKVLGDNDVVKCDKPAVSSLKDLANVVLNNQAAVIVFTKSHPGGEIAGKIGMHKSYVYSDGPGGYHDPKLHAGHSAPATSTPSSQSAAVDPATPPLPTK